MLRLKPWSVSHCPAFMSSRPITIHMYLALEFPFKEMGHGLSPIYHLVVNEEKWKAGGAQNSQQQCLKVSPQTFFQLKKFLGRIAFGILSNFNDGAPLRKYVERL